MKAICSDCGREFEIDDLPILLRIKYRLAIWWNGKIDKIGNRLLSDENLIEMMEYNKKHGDGKFASTMTKIMDK